MFVFVLICVTLGFATGLEERKSLAEINRFEKIEAILESLIDKNQKLEQRVEKLEEDLNQQKHINIELKKEISILSSLQTGMQQENVAKMMFALSDKQHFHTTEAKQQINDDLSDTKVQNTEKRNHITIPNRRKEVKRLLEPLHSTSPPPAASPLSPVAFTAALSSGVSNLGAKQTIIFDSVVTNVGGSYHTSHGNFVAPRDGGYVFALTAMPGNGQTAYLQIVKDGVPKAAVYIESLPDDLYKSGSTVITLALSKGNEVWVQTAEDVSWHGTNNLHGSSYTSFSGWILS